MGCTCGGGEKSTEATPAQLNIAASEKAAEPVLAASEHVSEQVEAAWEAPVYVDENGPVRMGSLLNPSGPCGPAHLRVERFEAGTFRPLGGHELKAPLQTELRCQDGVCLPWVRFVRSPKEFQELFIAAQALGTISSSERLDGVLRPWLLKQDQEVFLTVCLDTQLRVRSVSEIARGLRDRVEVGVPDVLRIAISSGASFLIVVHNHPSGVVTPSKSDHELTMALVHAVNSVDLALLDHVIIGTGGRYSFADDGKLPIRRAKGKDG